MTEQANASLPIEGNTGSNVEVKPVISAGEKGNVATSALPTFAEQLENNLKSDKDFSQWLGNWKDKKLTDFVKDNYELGKSTKDLQGKLEGMVKVPGEKATQEETMAFRKALNVPEKPEGYEIKRPEKLPDGMIYDESLEASFKSTVHKLGLSPAQASGLADMFNNYEIEKYSGVSKIIAENREKSVNILKDVWKGSAYEENRTKATKTFFETLRKLNPPKEFGGLEGIEKDFTESGMGDNPAMVWYFSKLYDAINIDSFGNNSASPSGDGRRLGMLDFSTPTKR